ncbi:MAG: alpha/beta hydrolase [Acidimicrobiales bacterium]|jgi:pimeloyl-ACP methyl ester carboxylesterase
MTERPAVPAGYRWHDLETRSGHLEVLIAGSEDGFPLVFHSGTPSGAAPFPLLVEAAADRDFRTITYSRPGYGSSSPLKGRAVAGAASDTVDVLASLGYDDYATFVTAGWSGGGPHALACTALQGDRCLGAAIIAGVAPFDGDGLEWTAGMAEENLVEFGAALKGTEDLEEFLRAVGDLLATVDQPAALAEALGGLVTERDKEVALNSGVGRYLIGALQAAVREGTAGWRDDDIALVSPWGFDPATIERPVGIWQGTEDHMVPVSHGRWLAKHLSAAHLALRDGEGHLSIVPIAIPQLLDDLAGLARLGS